MTVFALGPVVPIRSPRRDRVIAALLALAAVGAMLSVLLPAGCGGCERAKRAAGTLPLAQIGLVFYGGLLLAAMRWGTTRGIQRAVLLAAGVHLALFTVLLWKGAMCWLCIGTGLCAITASAYLLYRGYFSVGYGTAWLLTGLLAIGGPTVGYMRYTAHAGERQAIAAAQEILRTAGQPLPGQVEIIVLTRQGCSHCETFKKTILPTLLCNPAVKLDERPAADEMPTPTVVMHGTKAYTAIGLKSLADYQRMLTAAGGQATQAPSNVVLLDIEP